MPIQGTISADTSSNTMTLAITQGPNTIESLVYTQSTNSLQFAPINAFSLSAADFIAFAAMLDSFNTSVARTFNPSMVVSPNFTIHKVQDENNGTGDLTFEISKTTHPIYSITASYPLGTVDFSHRNNITTLFYDEWLYYHNVSLHFEDEIHKFYKI